MRRLLFLVILCMFCSVYNSFAQTDSVKVDTLVERNNLKITSDLEDSLLVTKINTIYNKLENIIPRYKIFKTENIYTLLKLDTATGRVWQVQYRSAETSSKTIVIDSISLLELGEPIIPGRFELYPTNNIYKFILVDTKLGGTWLVQWNVDANKRFRERIYD